MDAVFKPWIGSKYLENQFGVRILILGESHYGDNDDKYDEYTIDVIKLWGKERRLAFFSKITKSVLNYDSSDYLSDAERSEFWEHVAFYNYVQAIVGAGARIRPTDEMWKKSESALYDVIKQLKPQLVIVLGIELQNNLPPLPENLSICCLAHPSSGRFSYSENNKLVQNAIQAIQRKVTKM